MNKMQVSQEETMYDELRMKAGEDTEVFATVRETRYTDRTEKSQEVALACDESCWNRNKSTPY